MNPLAWAIGATILLGVGKLVGAALTGSQAVFASAADSLADAGVSALNLWMMRKAATPADEDHPFGHGKAEALASLAQGIILAGVVVGVGQSAIQRLASGEVAPIAVGPAMVTMVLSMCGSLAISLGLSRAAKRTGSLVLASDAVHYRMDLWTGLAVLAGLAGTTLLATPKVDAVASLLVCAIMAKELYGLLRGAVGELMDEQLPEEERARLITVLDSYRPRICAWSDLRTRRAGPARYVQVRLLLPGALSLTDGHNLAHEVEAAVEGALPGADVLVHIDAEGA